MPTYIAPVSLLWLIAAGFCVGFGWALAHWLVARITR